MINPERKKEITHDVINTFINGTDGEERIVNLEYQSRSDKITIYYRDENDIKRTRQENFYPFVWATRQACERLCNGDREEVKRLMRKYGISIKVLDTKDQEGKVNEIIAQNGYIFMLISKMPMSYQKFLAFFKECGNPIYSNDEDEDSILTEGNKNQYLCVTPQEMFLISTGKRFFKGYSDYDELLRLIIDLETSGLDPKTESIEQIGVRFNRPVLYKGEKKPYEKIISIIGDTDEEKKHNELESIKYLLSIISYFNPDIVTAHNGENFDWNFIITRCEMLGTSIDEICKKNNFFDGRSIYKSSKATSLKLGGEVETFNQTVIPGKIVTDSLHAVRRAQALDSNMLKANLKYVTKYSKMQKVNRVYVPGEQISQIWNDNTFSYAFNDENGDWYHIEDNKPIKENYVLQTGKYIVERYLLDDLWECDKVEHRYNTPNFMVCKMLPVPYQKCCTMGTAGQWKMLMLAWSFENGLAIPPFGSKRKFTGGLSRLLCVGWIPKVAKFDYNSLYPSIDLTWKIQSPLDLSGVTLKLLEYVLTEREKYKGLKKAAAKEKERIKDICEKEGTTNENIAALRKAEAEESANDKKQLPLKIFGNSFFGSFGAVDLFPWGDVDCAEQTTCTGRQSLRLMISWFSNLGYKPIVGDSFTPDTPLFIRWKDSGMIDILPIEALINPNAIKIDELGREYDYSEKPFEVLCRSGWATPKYIYRHICNKDIYEVSEGDMRVEVTEDHSLFNSNKVKIKPSEINLDTKLEYYSGEIKGCGQSHLYHDELKQMGINLTNNPNGKIDCAVLNTSKENMKVFYDSFMMNYKNNVIYSKTIIAGLQYIKKILTCSKD